MTLPHFDAITSKSALEARIKSTGTLPLNRLPDIPNGSSWSSRELLSARVVVRSANHKNLSHVLPVLRDYVDPNLITNDRIKPFCEGPDINSAKYTETELVHRHGPGLGVIWAGLERFRKHDHPEPGQSPSLSPKRQRKAPDRFGSYVPSTIVETGSRSSNESLPSSISYIPSGDPAPAVELATVDLVTSTLRYVLSVCPPQHDTVRDRPMFLVEFSPVSRMFKTKLSPSSEVISATSDGELLTSELLPTGVYQNLKRPFALLEAKRHFLEIGDGKPVVSDELLGQMTCEALALRLKFPGDRYEKADEMCGPPHPLPPPLSLTPLWFIHP